jgi:hypothetical protein
MSDNADMERIALSYREKQAWIVLVTTLAVYGVYFFAFGRAWMAGQGAGFGLFAPMAATVVALVVLQIVLSVASAIIAPSEAGAPADERDRMIARDSARAGFVALQAGVATALLAVALGVTPALAANGLLLVMVLGEVTRSAWQVVGYRRSAA